MKSMIKKLALTSVAILVSSSVNASNINVEQEPSLADMLYYLYVTPYDFQNKYINKMIYFKNPSVTDTCSFTKKGKYLFSDVEGGTINNFDVSLPAPSDSSSMTKNEYLMAAKDGFKLIKETRCLDVNLAPVIDFNLAGRGYYDQASGRYYAQHLDAFVKANKSNGISVTYKHYPPSYQNNSPEHDLKLYDEAKSLWTKSSEQLSLGYSEAWREQLMSSRDGKLKQIADEMIKGIQGEATKYDYVMLDNALFLESNYEPYVSSTLPQSDAFLQSFPGLIITDDLYQLNTETINVRNLFVNADLLLVSSLQDLKILHKRMTETIAKEPELIRLLVAKYEKVSSVLPLK